MFIYGHMVTLFVNLVNFNPVTPEFTKVKDVHPVVSLIFASFDPKIGCHGNIP